MILPRSASSTMRASQEFCVTCIAPLTSDAARKNQKFCANAQTMQGITHAMTSNQAVVARRPRRSVMTPPARPNPTCETMPSVASRPICAPARPPSSDWAQSTVPSNS